MSEENKETIETKVEEKNQFVAEKWQPAEEKASAEDTASLDRIASLEASLAAKTAELEEAKKTLDAQAIDIDILQKSGAEAVKAYRKLAASSNPLFSEDVLAGDTIADVDAAMARVLDLAGKVRSHIEAEIKSVNVPAGAPERSGPDLSSLSAREKIKMGLEEKK